MKAKDGSLNSCAELRHRCSPSWLSIAMMRPRRFPIFPLFHFVNKPEQRLELLGFAQRPDRFNLDEHRFTAFAAVSTVGVCGGRVDPMGPAINRRPHLPYGTNPSAVLFNETARENRDRAGPEQDPKVPTPSDSRA